MTPAEWHAEALRLADVLAEASIQHECKSRGLVGFTRTRDAVQAARAALSLHLLAYPVGEVVGEFWEEDTPSGVGVGTFTVHRNPKES